MTYVDMAVYAVPTANKEAFVEHAEKVAAIFKKHGARSVADCWGDQVPDGEVTSLPMAVQCKDDETVAFSWITWASKEAHDEGMAKAMADMDAMDEPMPFDGKRMIFGSFETVVEI